MLKTKTGQIGANVFIYLITAVVIIVILAIGYNSLFNIKERMNNAEIILLNNQLTSDIKSISNDFGTFKKKTYSFPNFAELCLVDIDKKNTILGSELINSYPLLKDSIQSGIDKNAFIVSDTIFESFFIGDFEINHYPHFICLKPEANEIKFGIEGLGDKALILTEFIASIKLDQNVEIKLQSSDDVVELIIPPSTTALNVDGTIVEEISIEIVDPTESVFATETASDIYEFEPSGTTFSPPIELNIRYDPGVVGECPDSLTFYQYNDDGSLKAEIISTEIDCEGNIATFEINGFSWGYVSAPRKYECIDTDVGLDYYSKGVIHYFDEKNVAQDFCSSYENRLIEYYCAGDKYNKIVFECPNGCFNGACMKEPLCGNLIIDPEELCDGTTFGDIDSCTHYPDYVGGILTCDSKCQIDTSSCIKTPICGNSICEEGEEKTCVNDCLSCTTDYVPVCGQPPMPPCPEGFLCTQVMPEPKTYGNKCELGKAGAEFLYGGECQVEVIPVCGDGIIDSVEQCDDGAANADGATCTTACRNNICGDGFVYSGIEQCDGSNFGSISTSCSEYRSDFSVGNLICTSCQISTENCGDGSGGVCGDEL